MPLTKIFKIGDEAKPAIFSLWSEICLLLCFIELILLALPHEHVVDRFVSSLNDPVKFEWLESLNFVHLLYRVFSILLVFTLFSFWLASSIVKYVQSKAMYCVITWRHIGQQLMTIHILINITFTIGIGFWFGYLQTDMTNVLQEIYNKSEDGYHSQDFARIQQQYKCCGIDHPDEWLDHSRNRQEEFPLGCCNRETVLLCSPKLAKEYYKYTRANSDYAHNRGAQPHFTVPCSYAVSQNLESDLFNTHIPKFIAISLLSLILFFSTFKGAYCTALIAQNNEKNNVYPSSYHPRRYMSNAQILSAMRDHSLLCPEEKTTNSQKHVRDRFLEEKLGISWNFTRNKKPVRFLTRFDKVDRYRPGQLSTSRFRRTLRSYCPLLEAVLYTDGEGVLEFQANSYYGGFIVYCIRGVVFILLGIIMALIILVPLQRKIDKKLSLRSTEGDDGREFENRSQKQQLNDYLANLNLLIRVSIMCAFIFGSVSSLRVRTMLILILPTLCLKSGKGLIVAEIVRITLDGPVQNTFQNVKTITDSMKCFSKLIANMSSVTRVIHMDSHDAPEGGGYFMENMKDSITGFSQKSKGSLQTFHQNAQNFIIGAVYKMKSNTGPSGDSEFKPRGGRLRDAVMHEQIKKSETQEDDFQTRLWNREKVEYDKMLEGLHLGDAERAKIIKKMEQGFAADGTMRKYIRTTCFMYKNSQAKGCLTVAEEVCGKLAYISSVSSWMKRLCLKVSTTSSRCKAVDHHDIVAECNRVPATLGHRSGMGAEILQLAINSKEMAYDYMDVEVVSNKAKALKERSSVEILKYQDLTYKIMYYAKTLTELLKGIAVIISALNLLVLLKTLFKAKQYMHKYLNDLDFDNVYLGHVFENVDETRKREGRTYLMPLKSWEKKQYTYRKILPTGKEIMGTIAECVKVGLFIGAIYSLFLVDQKVASILRFVRELMFSEIAFDATGSASTINEINSKHRLSGSGFFYSLLRMFLGKLEDIGSIRLDFSMASCAPDIQAIDDAVYIQFWIYCGILIFISLFKVVLLRTRHLICAFSFPHQELKRSIHAYNEVLMARYRILSTNKSHIVTMIKHGTYMDHAQKKLVTRKSLFLASKCICCICLDRRKQSDKSITICDIDHTAVCVDCMNQLDLPIGLCITCLITDDDNREMLLDKLRDYEGETKDAMFQNVDLGMSMAASASEYTNRDDVSRSQI